MCIYIIDLVYTLSTTSVIRGNMMAKHSHFPFIIYLSLLGEIMLYAHYGVIFRFIYLAVSIIKKGINHYVPTYKMFQRMFLLLLGFYIRGCIKRNNLWLCFYTETGKYLHEILNTIKTYIYVHLIKEIFNI